MTAPVTRDEHLLIALEAAVPLRILDMRDWTPETRINEAVFAMNAIDARGDVLQYGGGKRGDVAHAFKWLATGLAAAAYQPGGVTFAGRHWCTDHAACVDAATSEPASLAPPRPRRAVEDVPTGGVL